MKCTHCNKTLGLGNFAALNGKYYCKPHFKQLFQQKGNYSDGFGEEKPTAKWAPQAIAFGGVNDFTKPKKVTATSPKVSTSPKVTTPKVETPKEEPKVEEPKVEEPKVEEPKVEEPKEEPKVEEPKVVEPKVVAPTPEKPKITKSSVPERVDTPTISVTPPQSSSGVGLKIKSETCVVCGKRVYAMDKMVADGVIFHKTCMKCTHCNKTLGLGNFAALNGKYYCKPHFKQLFQQKGNYSDGFGEEKPTAKWAPQAPAYATGAKKFF